MLPIALDPPAAFAIADGAMTIGVVGCGGTGSHLLELLARVLYDRTAAAERVTLLAIDGDTVEPRNLHRQRFSARDLGANKVQALTARLNAAYGLKMQAVPDMATAPLLQHLGPGSGRLGLLVGCVDTAHARRVLAGALGRNGWRLWIDCGNEEYSGQVVLGTTTRRRDLAGCLRLCGLATALPALPLVFPDVLTDGQPQPVLDCAGAVATGRQSLFINAAIAQIAASYVAELLLEQRVTSFWTDVDIRARSMRTHAITARALAQATGLRERTLRARSIRPRPVRKGEHP